MKEIIVNTDALKKSVSNVRAGHSKSDIKTMAASIKANGIINPPTVALNGDGKFEIIAGQLRVAGAIAAGEKSIRCLDATEAKPEERISLSLSENVVRRSMTSIEKYAAFHKLNKAGTPVEEIATIFNLPVKRVQQVLAIGRLPKKILALAEDKEITDQALEALAIAPESDVKKFAKLPDKKRPRGWQIVEWLKGDDGWYPADAALFDLEDYDGPSTVDLFSEDNTRMLTDGTQFWLLQRGAIATEVEKLEKLGWKVTEVEYFNQYANDKASKKDGGQVFYTVSQRTGNVQFYKGYKPRGKAGPVAAKAKDGEAAPKPETSKAFDNFMAETRHAAVQAYMIQNKRAGLEATLLLLLKECDNISFRSGGLKLSDAYNDSVHSSDDFIYMIDAWTAMLDELGLKDGTLWGMDLNIVAGQLDEYTPGQILEWINICMARKWDMESSSKDSDALGKALGLTQVNLWEPDDAFWDGIKNKQTLIDIANELNIPIDEKATTTVIRKILKEKRPDNWRPKWLLF